MSRGVTLATGRGKTLVLIAAAMLLASLFTIAGSAVAPSRALAVAGGNNDNCNSAINPIGADGVTVSFLNTNGNVLATGSGATATYTTWYDEVDGKFYGQQLDGTASATNSTLEVHVTYGGSNGTDPWCIFTGTVVQTGGGYNLRNSTLLHVAELDATDATSYTFSASFDLNGYSVTNASGSLCVAARISSRQGGGGAPKGSACLTVATHLVSGRPTPTPTATPTPDPSVSPTPTPTADVGGATNPPTDTGMAANSRAPMLGLILLVLATIAGLAGLLTPASKRIRR